MNKGNDVEFMMCLLHVKLVQIGFAMYVFCYA